MVGVHNHYNIYYLGLYAVIYTFMHVGISERGYVHASDI